MRKSLDTLYDCAAYAAAVFMVGTLASVLAGILDRYLALGFRGTDMYAGYCMAAAGFLALAHTLKRGDHIRVTLILQKLTGPGKAFLEIPGEVREYNLQPGQVLKVDPGHIAAFEPSVTYDIATVKGVTNVLFSGEGLFLATLSGPGRVWLQSLPLSNLAAKLARFMPAKSS